LPAAIAAPTPVSSLVHSSTLVTAGVYLIFRFCPRIFNNLLIVCLMVRGRLTIIIAGLSATMEIDIKKIVALSTLSQLGVIIFSLRIGAYHAAFFHLLSHAFFKALLFITVGNIIHISKNYQDLRKINLQPFLAPLTIGYILRANLRLCGLPFTRGFFSKDLCIESAKFLSIYSISIILFYIATALTATYTVRFIILTCAGSLSRA